MGIQVFYGHCNPATAHPLAKYRINGCVNSWMITESFISFDQLCYHIMFRNNSTTRLTRMSINHKRQFRRRKIITIVRVNT
jgi:hypothetical protein